MSALEIAAQRGATTWSSAPGNEAAAFRAEKTDAESARGNVEVAGRTAAHTRLAFTPEPDTGAVLDAGGM